MTTYGSDNFRFIQLEVAHSSILLVGSRQKAAITKPKLVSEISCVGPGPHSTGTRSPTQPGVTDIVTKSMPFSVTIHKHPYCVTATMVQKRSFLIHRKQDFPQGQRMRFHSARIP